MASAFSDARCVDDEPLPSRIILQSTSTISLTNRFASYESAQEPSFRVTANLERLNKHIIIRNQQAEVFQDVVFINENIQPMQEDIIQYIDAPLKVALQQFKCKPRKNKKVQPAQQPIINRIKYHVPIQKRVSFSASYIQKQRAKNGSNHGNGRHKKQQRNKNNEQQNIQKVSMETLDKELDEYMKDAKHQRIVFSS